MKQKVLFISLFCVGFAIIFRVFFFDLPFVNKIFKFKSDVELKYDSITGKSGIFTKDNLKQYNGIVKKELYLSILGVVYDVSRAEKHYGPGKSYHIFAGKDASKSFITGNFKEDEISDDVSELTSDELLSLKQWKSFYDREYTKKGILIGRYYDNDGNPTSYFEVIKKLFENAEKLKSEKNLNEKQYPPCNIEWNIDTGTRVWCSDKSGGISRNWIGFPRKYFKPGGNSHRCACVENIQDKDPKIELYINCDEHSISCFITN